MTGAIAITGLTGSLGRALATELLRQKPDRQLVVIARNPAAALRDPELGPVLATMRGRLRWIEADLADFRLQESDRQLLSEASSLWHLAACTSLHQRACPERIHRVNTVGTQRLLELLARLPDPPEFHYVSTAFVAGRRCGTVREEELDCGQSHRNAYERSKMQAEASAREWLSSGGRGAIYRPSLVLEDTFQSSTNIASVFARLVAQAVRRGEPQLTLRLPQTASINLVPAAWTAQTMLALAERAPLEEGLAFHLTAQSNTSLSSILAFAGAKHPEFGFRFRPNLGPSAITGVSRLLDWTLADLKGYLGASLSFDRSNTLRALADQFAEPDLDLGRRAAEALALSA